LEHYYDLWCEAEQDRLARQALAGRPKNHPVTFTGKLWCQGLNWLGSRLSAWGKQLQEQYGTAVAGTTFVKRQSEGAANGNLE
jgi:hypothetical protein